MTRSLTAQELEKKIREGLHRSCEEVLGRKLDRSVYRIELERPKKAAFGDLAASFILRLAKEEKKNPRALAEEVLESFTATSQKDLGSFIEKVNVEGPGYLNIVLSHDALVGILYQIHDEGDRFGSTDLGKGKRILVEFVSANPTGPLTVAHGRQAALGDTLARVLKHLGFEAHREYYNNDEGVQIDLLGQSLYVRMQESLGKEEPLPENGYQGGYIRDLAESYLKHQKNRLPKSKEELLKACSNFAQSEIFKGIQKDLEDFDVHFDRFYSQKDLSKSGQVQKALEALRQEDAVYEKDEAVWLRTTTFGDDKDRVIVKRDKSYTYLMPDIAYHHEKFERGYDELIDILGPDHHGYIARLKASQAAMGHDPACLRVLIAQLVTLYEGKKQLRMSTRSGEFVTLREVLNEVGKDAARFFFCMRRFDTHLDFDLKLAKSQSQDNPVYYVQYAYARISSIERLREEKKIKRELNPEALHLLKSEEELRVLKFLRQFPPTVIAAGTSMEPSFLIEYLGNLAALFHQFYSKHRVVTDDMKLTQARLELIFAIQKVIRVGLNLLGVSAPDRM
jgi:arginyl-tRNA synthetase